MRPALTIASAPGESDVASQLVEAGPPIPRAPTDVGGLLDTTKGWTLHIPGPDESSGAAARMIASQQVAPAPAREIAAATPVGPAAGSR